MNDRVRQLGFLKALVRFGQGIEDRQDLSKLLQRGIVLGVRALDVSHGKVMRYRPERGDLLVVAGVGWKPGVVGHLSISTDSAAAVGRALQTAQPVSVEHLPTNQTLRYPKVLQHHGKSRPSTYLSL